MSMKKLNEFCDRIVDNIFGENDELLDILNNPEFSIEDLDLNISDETIKNAVFHSVFNFNNSNINLNNSYKDYLNKVDKNMLKDRLLFFITVDKNLTKDEKQEKIAEIAKNKLSKKVMIDKINNTYKVFIPQMINNFIGIVYYSLPKLLEILDENGYCKVDINEIIVEHSLIINFLANSLLMFANKKENYLEIHMPKEILSIIKDKVDSEMESVIENNDKLFSTIIKLINVYGLFKLSDISKLTNNFNDYSDDEIRDKIVVFGILAPLFNIKKINDETIILSNDIDVERDEYFINELLQSKLPYKKYSDEELDKYIDNNYITNLKEYKRVIKSLQKEVDEEFVEYIMQAILPTFISYYLIDEDLAYEFLEDEDLENFYGDFEEIAIKCPIWKLKGDKLN